MCSSCTCCDARSRTVRGIAGACGCRELQHCWQTMQNSGLQTPVSPRRRLLVPGSQPDTVDGDATTVGRHQGGAWSSGGTSLPQAGSPPSTQSEDDAVEQVRCATLLKPAHAVLVRMDRCRTTSSTVVHQLHGPLHVVLRERTWSRNQSTNSPCAGAVRRPNQGTQPTSLGLSRLWRIRYDLDVWASAVLMPALTCSWCPQFMVPHCRLEACTWLAAVERTGASWCAVCVCGGR